MINRKLAGAFLIAVGLSLGFGIGSLRAAGVPQTQPLLYSGTLLESGQPVTGPRNIRISLWKNETSTVVADRTCETVANGTTVESGRFRVSLDPTCVTAVHAEPEQWVEVEVAGTLIGTRAKLGAVPYALEAASANDAKGALDTRLDAVEGALPSVSVFEARRTLQIPQIPTTSPTTVIFNQEDIDMASEYDPSTGAFIPKTAGIYQVGCAVAFLPSSTAADFEVSIRVNSNVRGYGSGRSDPYYPSRSARRLMRLNVGDVVTCTVYQDSGGPLTLDTNGWASSFDAIRIAP